MRLGSDSATILFVEDDAVLGQVLGRVLTQDGHAVHYAHNRTQALQLVDEQLPDLVLIDASLRDGSGLQLGESLRDRYPDLPVILLTAATQSGSKPSGWSADRLLSKSVDLSDLRQAVTSALAGTKVKPPTSPLMTLTELPPSSSSSLPDQGAVRPAKESKMRFFKSKLFKSVAGLLLALLILAGFASGALRLPGSGDSQPTIAETSAGSSFASPNAVYPEVELVQGQPHTLFVPEDVRKALGIIKDHVDQIAVATKPTRTRPLEMPGSMAFDPTRTFRIRARFAPSPSSAEVIQIAQTREDQRQTGKAESTFREIRSGDRVVKGELLAAFNSDVVGTKKNDLIDAVYQLALDEAILKRFNAHPTAVPDYLFLNAQRNVQTDKNTIEKSTNTLKTWGISEDDIQAVLDEAENVKKRGGKRDKSKDALWGRVEVKAPSDGTIVEMNLSLHDIVVDNSQNLFQIVDLDKFFVTANIPEDELPVLEALRDSTRGVIPWTVTTVGSPPIAGYISDISYIIDKNQHTAIAKGYVDNKDAKLRAGQFITAAVELPPPPDVVEVPTKAVVEDGQQSVVFVQKDPKLPNYTLRRVELTARFEKTVFVRSKPLAKAEARSDIDAELGMLPIEPLLPGERVLESGVGELKKEVLNRESEQRLPAVSDTKALATSQPAAVQPALPRSTQIVSPVQKPKDVNSHKHIEKEKDDEKNDEQEKDS